MVRVNTKYDPTSAQPSTVCIDKSLADIFLQYVGSREGVKWAEFIRGRRNYNFSFIGAAELGWLK